MKLDLRGLLTLFHHLGGPSILSVEDLLHSSQNPFPIEVDASVVQSSLSLARNKRQILQSSNCTEQSLAVKSTAKTPATNSTQRPLNLRIANIPVRNTSTTTKPNLNTGQQPITNRPVTADKKASATPATNQKLQQSSIVNRTEKPLMSTPTSKKPAIVQPSSVGSLLAKKPTMNVSSQLGTIKLAINQKQQVSATSRPLVLPTAPKKPAIIATRRPQLPLPTAKPNRPNSTLLVSSTTNKPSINANLQIPITKRPNAALTFTSTTSKPPIKPMQQLTPTIRPNSALVVSSTTNKLAINTNQPLPSTKRPNTALVASTTTKKPTPSTIRQRQPPTTTKSLVKPTTTSPVTKGRLHFHFAKRNRRITNLSVPLNLSRMWNTRETTKSDCRWQCSR